MLKEILSAPEPPQIRARAVRLWQADIAKQIADDPEVTPEGFERGVSLLDRDADAAVSQLRSEHVGSFLQQRMGSEARGFFERLQQAKFDADQLAEEDKPHLAALEEADAAFQDSPSRIYASRAEVAGKQVPTVLRRDGSSLDAIFSLPDGSRKRVRLPDVTDADAEREIAQEQQRLASLEAMSRAMAPIRPAERLARSGYVPGGSMVDAAAGLFSAHAGDAAAVAADEKEAAKRIAESRARIAALTQGRASALLQERLTSELKRDGYDASFPGALEEAPAAFSSGLAQTRDAVGALYARAFDEPAFQRMVQDQAERPYAEDDLSAARERAGVPGKILLDTSRTVGQMFPFLLGGAAARGGNAARGPAYLESMDAGKTGVMLPGMAATAAGQAYLESAEHEAAARRDGDTAKADRIRRLRDLHALASAAIEASTERLFPGHMLKPPGSMGRAALGMVQESGEEVIAGRVSRGELQPVTLEQSTNPWRETPMEAATGFFAAAPMMAAGAMLPASPSPSAGVTQAPVPSASMPRTDAGSTPAAGSPSVLAQIAMDSGKSAVPPPLDGGAPLAQAPVHESRAEQNAKDDAFLAKVSAERGDQLTRSPRPPRHYQARIGQRLAKLFGLRLAWFETTRAVEGTIDRKRGVIWLNKNQPSLGIAGTVMHEAWHDLAKNHPDLAHKVNQLFAYLVHSGEVDAKAFRDYLKSLGYSPAEIHQEEALAHVVNDLSYDAKFWELFFQHDPSLGSRVLKILLQWIERVVQALTPQEIYDAGATHETARFLNSEKGLNALRAEIARAYANLAKRSRSHNPRRRARSTSAAPLSRSGSEPSPGGAGWIPKARTTVFAEASKPLANRPKILSGPEGEGAGSGWNREANMSNNASFALSQGRLMEPDFKAWLADHLGVPVRAITRQVLSEANINSQNIFREYHHVGARRDTVEFYDPVEIMASPKFFLGAAKGLKLASHQQKARRAALTAWQEVREGLVESGDLGTWTFAKEHENRPGVLDLLGGNYKDRVQRGELSIQGALDAFRAWNWAAAEEKIAHETALEQKVLSQLEAKPDSGTGKKQRQIQASRDRLSKIRSDIEAATARYLETHPAMQNAAALSDSGVESSTKLGAAAPTRTGDVRVTDRATGATSSDAWSQTPSAAPVKSELQSSASEPVRLAPNGSPSNLNARQYAQVRTPQFKRWFGDWEKAYAEARSLARAGGVEGADDPARLGERATRARNLRDIRKDKNLKKHLMRSRLAGMLDKHGLIQFVKDSLKVIAPGISYTGVENPNGYRFDPVHVDRFFDAWEMMAGYRNPLLELHGIYKPGVYKSELIDYMIRLAESNGWNWGIAKDQTRPYSKYSDVAYFDTPLGQASFHLRDMPLAPAPAELNRLIGEAAAEIQRIKATEPYHAPTIKSLNLLPMWSRLRDRVRDTQQEFWRRKREAESALGGTAKKIASSLKIAGRSKMKVAELQAAADAAVMSLPEVRGAFSAYDAAKKELEAQEDRKIALAKERSARHSRKHHRARQEAKSKEARLEDLRNQITVLGESQADYKLANAWDAGNGKPPRWIWRKPYAGTWSGKPGETRHILRQLFNAPKVTELAKDDAASVSQSGVQGQESSESPAVGGTWPGAVSPQPPPLVNEDSPAPLSRPSPSSRGLFERDARRNAVSAVEAQAVEMAQGGHAGVLAALKARFPHHANLKAQAPFLVPTLEDDEILALHAEFPKRFQSALAAQLDRWPQIQSDYEDLAAAEAASPPPRDYTPLDVDRAAQDPDDASPRVILPDSDPAPLSRSADRREPLDAAEARDRIEAFMADPEDTDYWPEDVREAMEADPLYDAIVNEEDYSKAHPLLPEALRAMPEHRRWMAATTRAGDLSQKMDAVLRRFADAIERIQLAAAGPEKDAAREAYWALMPPGAREEFERRMAVSEENAHDWRISTQSQQQAGTLSEAEEMELEALQPDVDEAAEWITGDEALALADEVKARFQQQAMERVQDSIAQLAARGWVYDETSNSFEESAEPILFARSAPPPGSLENDARRQSAWLNAMAKVKGYEDADDLAAKDAAAFRALAERWRNLPANARDEKGNFLTNKAIASIFRRVHGLQHRVSQAKTDDAAGKVRTYLPDAAAHLRRNAGVRPPFPPGSRAAVAATEADKAALVDWARDAGILVNRVPRQWSPENLDIQDLGEGEHHVYPDKDNAFWVKITKGSGQMMGYYPEPSGDEYDLAPAGASRYIQRLMDANATHGDETVLIAVWQDRRNNVAIITAQPDVPGDTPTREFISAAMEADGFVHLPSLTESAYFRPADGTAVLDNHPGNAKKFGDTLVIYDSITLKPTGRLREIFEAHTEEALVQKGTAAPLARSAPPRVAYGAWLSPSGEVTPVSAHEGHESVAVAQTGEADAAAANAALLSQGWVRVVKFPSEGWFVQTRDNAPPSRPQLAALEDLIFADADTPRELFQDRADNTRPRLLRSYDAAPLSRSAFTYPGSGPYRVEKPVARAILTGSTLPKAFVEQIASTKDEVAAVNNSAARLARDLDAELKRQAALGVTSRAALEAQVNDALDDPATMAALASTNAPLHAVAVRLRNFLDQLSHHIAVQTGGQTGDTILANLGKWLRRSYMAFDASTGWNLDNLRAAAAAGRTLQGQPASTILRNAEAFLRSQSPTPLTPAQLENQMRKLTDRTVWLGVLSNDPDTKVTKDVTSLIRRKDIPAPLRALMGEVRDPLARFLQSASFQSQFIARHEMQRRMREIGLAMGVFTTDPQHTVYTAQVGGEAGDSNRRWSGFGELYTTPQMLAALQNAQGVMSGTDVGGMFLRAVKFLGGEAKLNKVALNPDSWMPNLFGNIVGLTASGDILSWRGWRSVARSWLLRTQSGRAMDALGNPSDRAALNVARALIARLDAAGVTNGGLDMQDLMENLNNPVREALESTRARDALTGAARGALIGSSYGRPLGAPVRAAGAALGAAAGAALGGKRLVAAQQKFATWLMSNPDNFAKTVAYLNNREAGRAAGMSTFDAHRRAVEITRDTMPDYSKLSPFFRELSRLGVLGSFIAFQHEVFRNTFHNLRYAAQELRSGNPALMLRGAQRLLGVSSVLTLGGWATVSQMLFGSGEDDEKDQAYRRALARPWDANSPLVYSKLNEHEASFWNMGYLIPQSSIFDFARAVQSADSWQDAVANLNAAFSKQFADGGVHTNPILEAISNQRRVGGKVSYAESPLRNAAERVDHILRAVFTPGYADKAERMERAALGRQRGDRVYQMSDELKRLMGIRATTLTHEQAIGSRLFEFARRADDARQIAKLAFSEWGKTAPDAIGLREQQSALLRANEARAKIAADYQAWLADLAVLGISEARVKAIQRERKAHFSTAPLILTEKGVETAK